MVTKPRTPSPSRDPLQGGLAARKELSAILSRYAQGKSLRHNIDTSETSSVRAVKICADGSLITGDDRGRARVWDPVTGKRRMEFHANTGEISALATSSDGRYLATGGWPHPGHLDYVVRIWDLRSGVQIQTRTLGGFNWGATLILFSSDNKRIITASPADETVKIWDLDTGLCSATLAEAHKRFPYILSDMVLTPDETCLLTAHTGVQRLLMWDLSTGTLVPHFGMTERGLTSLCVTPEGKRVVSGESCGTITVWDLKSGARIRTMENDGSTPMILSLSVASDGQRLASVDTHHRVRLWDLVSGKLLRSLDVQYPQCRSAFFSRDDRRLFVTAAEGVRVHDGRTLELLAALINTQQGFLWITPPDEHAAQGWFWTDQEDRVKVVEYQEGSANGTSIVAEESVRRKYIRVYNNRKMVMMRFNDPDKYRQEAQRHALSLRAADIRRQGAPLLLPEKQ